MSGSEQTRANGFMCLKTFCHLEGLPISLHTPIND